MGSRARLPAAVLAALAVAEAAVRLLSPRGGAAIAPFPVEAGSYFSPEERARARGFRRGQAALGAVHGAAELAALGGLVERARSGRARLPSSAAATAAGLVAGSTFLGLPFGAVGRRRALRVGLATGTWRAWLADAAKAGAISAGIAGGGTAAGMALVRRRPRSWWLPGAAGATAFGAVATWLAPALLDPLFNDFTPLPDGPRRRAVLELAERAGVDVGEVLVVDASRRTIGANAYVNGLGPTKRVVLFDTLLERFTDEEVRLVVAHELAHVRHRDVPRALAYLALTAPAGALAARHALEALAPPGRRDGRAVPALFLALGLAGAAVGPLGNRLSRRVEVAADAFALRLTGAPDAFVGFHRRIVVQNVARPDPPRWLNALLGTHPRPVDRIGAALAYKDTLKEER